MTGPTGWEPANEVEQEMLAALAVDDRERYFELIAHAPLYLPATGQAGGPHFTWELGEYTYLPVFTSPQALAASVGDLVDRYVVTSYAELARYWPAPDWRLAVNPGHPIDAWLPVEAVAEAAAGTRTVPTVRELRRAQAAPDGDDAGELDDALDAYLEALVKTEVLVPAAAPDPAPATIATGTFPWLVKEISGGPALTVFTSPEGFAAAFPAGTPCARVPFVDLVAAWPDPSWQLAVDPGAEVGFTITGDRVPGLLLWTGAVPDIDD